MNLKVIVAVVGVVALATLGVGVLMTGGLAGGDAPAQTDTGAQSGDDQSDSAATPTPTPSPTSTDTATAAPAEQTSEATANATATPTPTSTPTPTATPRPLNLNESEIEEHIAKYANDERRSRNLEPFDYTGLTAQEIAVMADNHSVSMAETDKTVHRIYDNTTADRYQRHGLYETCKYKSQTTSDIVKPDEEFETLGKTTVQAHVGNGETKYDVTEDELARTLLDKWMNSILYEDRLFQPETQRLGVGVEVTDSGEVYATANVCS